MVEVLTAGAGAAEGAALPAGWTSAVSRSTGETYFVNTVTGETSYDSPIGGGSAPAEQEQADASLPAGWKARRLAPSQRGIEGETYMASAGWLFGSAFAAVVVQAPYEYLLQELAKCNCVQTWKEGGEGGRLKRCLDGCACAAVAIKALLACAVLSAGLFVYLDFYCVTAAALTRTTP